MNTITYGGHQLVDIPLDPMDLDRVPPADLDVCGRCMGDGLIDTFVDGNLVDVVCHHCGGSGQLGGAA